MIAGTGAEHDSFAPVPAFWSAGREKKHGLERVSKAADTL